jgi:hypothetical protein
LRLAFRDYRNANPAQLPIPQRPIAVRAMRDRNLQNCLNGFDDCDRSRLSSDEQTLVAQAAHIQNLQNCPEEGEAGACDQSQLAASERAEVELCGRVSPLVQSGQANGPHHFPPISGERMTISSGHVLQVALAPVLWITRKTFRSRFSTGEINVKSCYTSARFPARKTVALLARAGQWESGQARQCA